VSEGRKRNEMHVSAVRGKGGRGFRETAQEMAAK
jgi:hypothetical protein